MTGENRDRGDRAPGLYREKKSCEEESTSVSGEGRNRLGVEVLALGLWRLPSVAGSPGRWPRWVLLWVLGLGLSSKLVCKASYLGN